MTKGETWYAISTGDTIREYKEQIEKLEKRVKELEAELQSIAEDEAGEDL